jgi:hypothetical protein
MRQQEGNVQDYGCTIHHSRSSNVVQGRGDGVMGQGSYHVTGDVARAGTTSTQACEAIKCFMAESVINGCSRQSLHNSCGYGPPPPQLNQGLGKLTFTSWWCNRRGPGPCYQLLPESGHT